MSNKPVALVSGGNRGMGLTTCQALARLDFEVLLGSRNLEAGEQALQTIRESGLSIRTVKLDVSSQADIDGLTSLIKSDYDRLDVLVNNAGILIDAPLGQPASIFDVDSDVLAKTFDVNTIGPIRLTNAVLPLMRKVGTGRIINISSGMGQFSNMKAEYAGYRISKTALNAATKIFAIELEGSGIAINAVSPGWVATDMGGENADLTPEEGIDTAIWLATEADISLSGGFYRNRQIIPW